MSLRFVSPRRAALRGILVQGVLWSIGNALTTGFLITFLGLELGAQPLGISLILALQSLTGLARLATPALVAWFGSTRRTCLVLSLVSYGVIAALPFTVWGDLRAGSLDPVTVMIVVLGVHQACEYLGAVALWAWFGELVPRALRGRFFARRNAWQMVCVTLVTPLSGWGIDRWKVAYPAEPQRLWGYAIALGLGATALLVSLLPLLRLPTSFRTEPRRAPGASPTATRTAIGWANLVAPWRDRTFRPLLAFIAWFSFSNGLTQAPQNILPRELLDLSLTLSLTMVTCMRVGQAAVSLPIGAWLDRHGHRTVLIVCQASIAAGLFAYGLATSTQPHWLWASWLLWIAYAGHNIGLPSLMLRLAPPTHNTAHVANYFALSGVVLALSTLAGGWLLEQLQSAIDQGVLSLERPALYRTLLWVGALLRSLGILFLVRIVEPAGVLPRR